MAEGKKSFIAYADWKDVFDELPNEDAGALIKHIFAYVNDENPVSDSILIKAVFANFKSTLKRDLCKWDKQLLQRSEAGKKSAEERKATKSNERSTVDAFRRRNSTDSVSVSVSVSDTVIDKDIYKRILLSEISKEKFPKLEDNHIKTAKAFQDLFIKNQENAGIKNSKIKKAKGTWVDDIRLMYDTDKITTDQFRKVFEFLKTDNFWDSVILSTKNLRKNFTTLLMKANNEKKSATNNSKIVNIANGITD